MQTEILTTYTELWKKIKGLIKWITNTFGIMMKNMEKSDSTQMMIYL